MGYDVHITRADFWAENEGHEISVSEWRSIVECDSELRIAGYNGPHFVIWDGHPEDVEAWLDWVDGNITTKNPDAPLLAKMFEIAGQLGAGVQGDDGEPCVDPPSAAAVPDRSVLSNGPLLSFVLSLVALLALAAVLPLDSMVRQDHPVGTPMPLKWALVLTAFGALGVISWFVGGIFALASLIFRQPLPYFAWIALALNGISATVLMLMQ